MMKKRFIFGWFYISGLLSSAIYGLFYGAILSIASLFTLITVPSAGIGGLALGGLVFGYGLLNLFIAAGLIAKTRWGFKLNKMILILWMIAFTLALVGCIVWSFISHQMPIIFIALISYLVIAGIYFCILSYFRKRKAFFHNQRPKRLVECLSISMPEAVTEECEPKQ